MAVTAVPTSHQYTLKTVWDKSKTWQFTLSENEFKDISEFVPSKDQSQEGDYTKVNFTYTVREPTWLGYEKHADNTYTASMCFSRDWESESKEALIYFLDHKKRGKKHSEFVDNLQENYRVKEKKADKIDTALMAVQRRSEMGTKGLHDYPSLYGDETLSTVTEKKAKEFREKHRLAQKLHKK